MKDYSKWLFSMDDEDSKWWWKDENGDEGFMEQRPTKVYNDIVVEEEKPSYTEWRKWVFDEYNRAHKRSKECFDEMVRLEQEGL